MTQFRTPIPIHKSKCQIDYKSSLVSLGSCFAINMAEQLDYYKFQNTCNPFGILFHPQAIHQIIRKSVLEELFTDEDIFFHNDLWHCFDVHSECSNPDKKKLLNDLNRLLEFTNQQIAQCSHLIITYGTSWVYRRKESGKIVANCHKVPQSQFQKELMSVKSIHSEISQTLQLIQKVNPDCTVIFTVSPVRHIKDGFIENQRSKAHLIAAIHMETEIIMHKEYFPSYEIMMDELRDYRFYTEDMLHPNLTAVDYIWQRFSEAYISENSHSVMEEVSSIQKALQHKPFHPESEKHQQFVVKIQNMVNALQKQYPHMQF